MRFPKITGFLSDPSDNTPHLEHAVVLNGYLHATNNKAAYYGSVELLTPDAKLRDMLEKKVFNREDLDALENTSLVEYREDGFKCYYEDGKAVFREWSGQIDTARQIHLYDDLMDEFVLAGNYKKYPDFAQIIPALTKNGDIDAKQIQVRNCHFRSVGMHAQSLSVITEALSFKMVEKPYLRLEFFHADKTKDKVDKVSAAIIVSAISSAFDSYKEIGIITPVF